MEPEGIEELTRVARRVRPDAVVWRGDQNLPPEQGLKVLGVPIGHPEFVKEFLEGNNREQVTLFQRIPWIEDTQVAFALVVRRGPIVGCGQFNPTKLSEVWEVSAHDSGNTFSS